MNLNYLHCGATQPYFRTNALPCASDLTAASFLITITVIDNGEGGRDTGDRTLDDAASFLGERMISESFANRSRSQAFRLRYSSAIRDPNRINPPKAFISRCIGVILLRQKQ
jgi:hypothetical protein